MFVQLKTLIIFCGLLSASAFATTYDNGQHAEESEALQCQRPLKMKRREQQLREQNIPVDSMPSDRSYREQPLQVPDPYMPSEWWP